MKISVYTLTTLCFCGNVSSFLSPQASNARQQYQMVETIEETPAVVVDEAAKEVELPLMSQSLPFMTRPQALTGELAGDVGFDPLGFAKSSEELLNYREAEIKHARLAMLAAAGWPLSEVFDQKLASALGMTPVVDAVDRVPSILNGGLGKVSPIYWLVCVGAAAAIDVYGISKSTSNSKEYQPGDLGFDPLGVFPKDAEGQKWMRLAEIKNGRLAMIAITAFAIQEAVTKVAVVNETPLFFFPLMETLKQNANSGYIQ